MVVCPQCGCPRERDPFVIGDWEVTCDLCSWKGTSQEMIEMPDGDVRFKDPRVFVELMKFLQAEISPQVANKLVQLGLVSTDKSPLHIRYFTQLLIDYSRAGFGAVLKGILNAGGTDELPT